MGERFSDNQRIEGTIPEMLDEALLICETQYADKDNYKSRQPDEELTEQTIQ